jgi:hypothetical protein
MTETQQYIESANLLIRIQKEQCIHVDTNRERPEAAGHQVAYWERLQRGCVRLAIET